MTLHPMLRQRAPAPTGAPARPSAPVLAYGLLPTVVVGGAAAGLELVTRLSRARAGAGTAPVVLVDQGLGHVWKPRLHEIAKAMQSPAGAETSYLGHARAHGYHFEIGALQQVDPARRSVLLAPLLGPDGRQVLPEREIAYGRLVLALGRDENDFGTPGAREHCLFLNNTAQAVMIREALLTAAFRIARNAQPQLSVVVIGGGATGGRAQCGDPPCTQCTVGTRAGAGPFQGAADRGGGRRPSAERQSTAGVGLCRRPP